MLSLVAPFRTGVGLARGTALLGSSLVPGLQVTGLRACAPLSFGRCKSSKSSKRWLQRQKNDPFSRAARHENLKSRAAFKLLQLDQRFHIFRSPGGRPLNVVDLGAAPGAWNQVALEKCPKRSRILGVDILPYQPPKGVSSMQANILSKKTHDHIRDFFAGEDVHDELTEVEILTSSGQSITVTENSVAATATAANTTATTQQDNHHIDTEIGGECDPVGDDPNEAHPLEVDPATPIDVVLSDMYAPILQISGYANSTTNNPYIRMANTSGLAVRDNAMSIDLCDAALIVAIDLLKPGGTAVMKFFTGELDQALEERLNVAFNKVHRFKPAACRNESKECYFVCQGKRKDVDKFDVFKVA